MNIEIKETDPKEMALCLMCLGPEEVAAKCRELNIAPTNSKYNMIDKIIVKTFGLEACKKAFARVKKRR